MGFPETREIYRSYPYVLGQNTPQATQPIISMPIVQKNTWVTTALLIGGFLLFGSLFKKKL